MPEITLSTSVLADLLDYLPNPDDPGPVGPWGPVIRWLDSGDAQPAAPTAARVVFGPRPEPWGPGPIPWRWAALAQATISAHLERLEMAGIIIVSGDTERAARASSESLTQFVDEICGTPPYKGPFPRPWGPLLDTETLHPIESDQCRRPVPAGRRRAREQPAARRARAGRTPRPEHRTRAPRGLKPPRPRRLAGCAGSWRCAGRHSRSAARLAG